MKRALPIAELEARGSKGIPSPHSELPIANHLSQSHSPWVVAGPPLKINLIARTEELHSIGKKARDWFLSSDRQFRKERPDLLDTFRA
jgi:hypothetical protein